jgi:anti-sigma factor RsiW
LSEQADTRWRDDLSAYLLGALPAGEAEGLEAHLESCETCQQELRWLRPVIEVLSDSVERIDPPRELRERLMAEVREDAVRLAQAAEEPARPPFGERMRGFMLRPATALAATAVIGAGAVGYVVAGSDGGRETTVIQASGPADLSATLSREGDTGTLKLAGVKQPAGKQVYQAWVQRGTRVLPSAPMRVRPDGIATARIPGLDRADNVMVTLEDRPGRAQPTTSPLVTLELKS